VKICLVNAMMHKTVTVVLFFLGIGNMHLAEAQTADPLPLKATRKIAFSTNVGTRMSVDVSPDGKTIVFDLLGDLYTLPISGGHATRITSGPAVDRRPRFSPDGKKLLFLSDRNGFDGIWISDADGTNAHELVSSRPSRWSYNFFADPTWMPDSRGIVVSRFMPEMYYALAAYDLTGHPVELPLPRQSTASARVSREEFIAGLAAARDGDEAYTAGAVSSRSSEEYVAGAAYSPDARHLYATKLISKNNDVGAMQFQVVRYDLTTGSELVVTKEQAGAVAPQVSPDGKYLAFAANYPGKDGPRTGLKLARIAENDSELQSVWIAPQIQQSMQQLDYDKGIGFLPNYAFLPANRGIVISYEGKIWRIALPTGVVAEIPFTAEVDQSLGPLLRFRKAVDSSPNVTARIIHDVRSSPDGRMVAFQALDRIWVAPALNGIPVDKPFRLTDAALTRGNKTAEGYPAWSPDGRYLSFCIWTERGGDVWRARVENLKASGTIAESWLERLTHEPDYYFKLVYKPDGSGLVAVRAPWRSALATPEEAKTALVSVPPDGGNPQLVTELGSGIRNVGWPHFSQRDSQRIFLRIGDTLSSFKFDGTDRRIVATAKYLNSDLLLSPDGTELAYERDAMVKVVRIPAGQGPFNVAVYKPGDFYASTEDITKTKQSDENPSLYSTEPVGRLPEGGEFPWWRADGQLTWSLGNTYFVGKQHKDLVAESPRDCPHGTLLLHNARIISMGKTGIIEHGDVLVFENRIRAVGPADSFPVPEGAVRMDLNGKTLLPGFMPTHEHFHPSQDFQSTLFWQYLLALSYGITSFHDPQGYSADNFSHADVLETGGLLGPRVFSTGSAVMQQEPLDSSEEVQSLVRRYSHFYHSDSLKQRDAGQRELRQRVAQAAFEENLTSVSHWNYGAPVSVVLDGYSGLEHAWSMPWYDDEVQLIARSGSVYTPTLMASSLGGDAMSYFARTYNVLDDVRTYRFGERANLAKRGVIGGFRPPLGRFFQSTAPSNYNFPLEAANAAKVVAAGGKVGIASDSFYLGLGVHWEMWAMVMGGMTPLQALQSATLTGAEAIGHDGDLGSIEPGKLADLQILAKNPLEDIHNSTSTDRVMKNGRLYDAMTLDEIWPNPRKLVNGADEAPWWWAEWPSIP
jgi:Tol biopolymer transport system component